MVSHRRLRPCAGWSKAFAAGADIKEMRPRILHGRHSTTFITRGWDRSASFRKPIIAAVAGFALGGGCELAMMCDFILAAETAKFGQPEINLGVMPGIGGTQRLTRFVGKSKAMDMCPDRPHDGRRRGRARGLVSRVVPLATSWWTRPGSRRRQDRRHVAARR
jgi:enoyl-CoA hydratase